MVKKISDSNNDDNHYFVSKGRTMITSQSINNIHIEKIFQTLDYFQETINIQEISKRDLVALFWLLDRISLNTSGYTSYTEGDYILNKDNHVTHSILEHIWDKEIRKYYNVENTMIHLKDNKYVMNEKYDLLSSTDHSVLDKLSEIYVNYSIEDIVNVMMNSPEYNNMLNNNRRRLSKLDFIVNYPLVFNEIFVMEDDVRESILALFVNCQAITHSITGHSEMLLEEFTGLEEYYQ